MANLIIKRKLDLDFLGEEHKDSYLTFRSVPVKEYGGLLKKIEAVQDNDATSATEAMLDILKDYFIDGVFDRQKVVKEDLDNLDADTVIKCFQTLTNRTINEDGEATIDPKVNDESTKPSSTEPQPQMNSSDTNTDEPSA